MYLSLLDENKKELFLEAALYLASADGSFGDDEEVAIQSYCYEMQIPYQIPDVIRSQNEIINDILTNADHTVGKIFIFELVGLAICDQNYDDSEKEFIRQICDAFEISAEYENECCDVITQYLNFQNRINHMVLG